MKWKVLVLSAFAFSLVLAIEALLSVRDAKRNVEHAMHEVALAATYEKGFWDGANAAFKHIKFDTNTGKASIELTNLFPEMKHVAPTASTNSP